MTTPTLQDHITALSRIQADYLDFMNTDVNTALSTLAYATARIVRSQAYAQGKDTDAELTRFINMLLLAEESENSSLLFNLN